MSSLTLTTSYTNTLESKSKTPRKVIVATTLGNALEMYDFTVFSFFSVLIGKLYFPASSELTSWLFALATFAVGFFMRPLGSIVIGHYSDKYGRKPALTLTIALMALGTGIIGFTPTYQSIGITAPILIILARLTQGFSAGGEVGSATSFLMESSHISKRGFMVSWQMMSQGVSAFLGAMSGALLSHFLEPSQLESWGWRLPFILGILIAPVGIYIRNHLDETLPASKSSSITKIEELPIITAITRYFPQLIAGTLLVVGGTTTMYITVFYLPAYANKFLNLAASGSYLTSCITGIVLMISSPFIGIFSDQCKDKKRLVAISAFLQMVLIFPFFFVLNQHPSFTVLFIGASLIMLCSNLGNISFLLVILEAFPISTRATALGLIYAVGVSIFGGLSQYNVTWIIKTTESQLSIAFYMAFCCLITLLAALFFPSIKLRK